VDEQLCQLVEKTCKHPPGSLKRQQNLTKLIYLIRQSQKLWRESSPYYEDALQQTWMYFCQNLCEAATGERYDPNRSSLLTWLNRYLKWRLHDFRISEQAKQYRTSIGKALSVEKTAALLENLPASPDIPSILEITRTWAQTDPDGELRGIHIENHPTVTCQVLILRRLPPETSWKELSREFGISLSTLSNFYRRQCMPRLRKFGESEGYV
jgi:hypothetical protein